MCLYPNVETWEVDLVPLLPVERIIDEGLTRQEPSERLAYVDLSRHAISLDKTRDEHILPEDVVAGDFRPNDTPYDFSRVDAHL